MLSRILSYFSPTKRVLQKSMNSFVNIASETGHITKSEEFGILKEAQDVIGNFAKKNNIKVDMFFKESNANDVNKQMVDITVKNPITNVFSRRTVLYKKDNKPIQFKIIENNIRYEQAESREYIQQVKSSPMKITVYNTVENKISSHEIPLPNIKIRIKEYNNYIPKVVGQNVYEDSFLRYVYRVIGQLEQSIKKTS